MKRIAVASMLCIALLSAGCTGTTGEAKPTPTTGGGTSTSTPAASPLDSMKPCNLLTAAEVTTAGLNNPGKEAQVATSAGCEWRAADGGGVRAGIRTKSGVKDLNLSGDKVSEIKVGGLNATKVEAQDGAKNACTIALSVSESSSVLVIATLNLSSSDTAAACDRASKAADLIAPKLS
ncbi:DUF3558 family protein [Lentzea sp. NPDC004782]|uniref:DUF3558 family protein n=1 Tax=Lentzea sp. NPDC004782 TaxID=3154458 RepID=UPI0033B92382